MGLSYSADASEVETVIIDGKVTMENRKILTMDEELVYKKIDEVYDATGSKGQKAVHACMIRLLDANDICWRGRNTVMERKGKIRLWALLSALVVLFGSALVVSAAEGTASSMKLMKTEGTVGLSGSTGKALSLRNNMRLYNGYEVDTAEKSYAWVNLDDTKLAKIDALSEICIRKNGKKLELLAESGNVFFEVSEPLGEEETFHIRTSAMVVGIRGTCGWVEIQDRKNVKLSVLEGKVDVSVTDPVSGEIKKGSLSSGETASCVIYEESRGGEKCDILLESYTKEDIKGFVLQEVIQNTSLVETIYQEAGIDLRDVTKEEAAERLQQDEAETEKKMEEVKEVLAKQESQVSTETVWAEADDGTRMLRPSGEETEAEAAPEQTSKPAQEAKPIKPTEKKKPAEGTTPTGEKKLTEEITPTEEKKLAEVTRPAPQEPTTPTTPATPTTPTTPITPTTPANPTSPPSQPEGEVSYLSCDADGQNWTTGKKSKGEYTVISENDIAWGVDDGSAHWYVAQGNVTIPSRITVTGDVRLILADGCNLNAGGMGGICVPAGETLTIYGQSSGSGSLTATAGSAGDRAGIGGNSQEAGGTITINGGTVTAIGGSNGAGIGGGYNGAGGTITINGGTVTATGGIDSGGSSGGSNGGAGIGGGYNGAGGTITINGGTVTATGGSQGGAGIGGGRDKAGGEITINGGEITATTSYGGAGIGGGRNGAGGEITINGGKITINRGVTSATNYGGAGIGGGAAGAGGKITINGGTVNATSIGYGAGIGGGNGKDGGTITITGGTVTAICGSSGGAGIGGGWNGAGGTITINGGTVTATGSDGGTGIGGNGSTFTTTDAGKAFIVASSISDNAESKKNAWRGVIFEGNEGTVYGDYTLTKDAEIPTGKTLTIPSGVTFTIPSGITLTNNGTIQNNGTLVINGTLNGTPAVGDGTVSGNGTVNNSRTINPQSDQGNPIEEPMPQSDSGNPIEEPASVSSGNPIEEPASISSGNPDG